MGDFQITVQPKWRVNDQTLPNQSKYFNKNEEPFPYSCLLSLGLNFFMKFGFVVRNTLFFRPKYEYGVVVRKMFHEFWCRSPKHTFVKLKTVSKYHQI